MCLAPERDRLKWKHFASLKGVHHSTKQELGARHQARFDSTQIKPRSGISSLQSPYNQYSMRKFTLQRKQRLRHRRKIASQRRLPLVVIRQRLCCARHCCVHELANAGLEASGHTGTGPPNVISITAPAIMILSILMKLSVHRKHSQRSACHNPSETYKACNEHNLNRPSRLKCILGKNTVNITFP